MRKDVRYYTFHAQAVRYSDTGQTRQAPAPPSSLLLDRFVNGEPLPSSSQLVDLKAAWTAFVELRTQSCPPQPSVVLGFVDRALSTIEETVAHGNKLRELVRWLVRLRRALRQLGDIEKNLPPAESAHALCLLTRVHALLGRFDDVISFLPRILDNRTNTDHLGHQERRMVETVLQALARCRSPVACLEFIVSQWYPLGRLVNMSSSASSPLPRRRSCTPSDVAFRIFAHIPSPVAVIADMRGKPRRDITLTGLLLIKYLLRRRVPEDALAVYREMRRQSADIKIPVKLWLVRALVQGHAIEQANRLFSEISASVPFDHQNELLIATALHLFSSQGDTTRSEAAFKDLEDKGVAGGRSIGMRLLAHAHNGDVETVVRYFHHHFPRDAKAGNGPDIFHYTAVLIAHANACDSAGLSKWLGNMIADGVMPDRHVYNILLEDCVRRGKFEEMASIIEEMRLRRQPPLTETYTTIITALAKRGDPVTAESVYKRALREGVRPDRQMVASLITAHAEVGSWKGVIRAYDYLAASVDRHLRPRIDVYNILLNAYVLAGSPFEVVADVFQKMEESGVRPTAHTFSILIKSACDSGQMDVAMRVFMELDGLARSWETGMKVNVYALTILMGGYLRIGDRLKAKEIYDEMLFRGIDPTSVTYGSIIKAYVSEGRQGGIRLACDFMKSLLDSPDQSRKWLSKTYRRFSGFENIYSPLMTLFARKAKPEQVEGLMDDMVKAGGERTLSTLTLLLNAYRNAGNADECRRVWDEILPIALRFLQTGELLGGLGSTDPEAPRPDLHRRANVICVPLSIHMDALSAAGEHAEVAGVWQAVRAHGFALDSHNWNHLMVVLVRAGEIERAFQILDRVIIPFIVHRHHQHQHHPSNLTATAAPRDRAPPTPLSYDDGADGPPPQDRTSAPAIASEEATRAHLGQTYLSATEPASVSRLLEKERAEDGHAPLPAATIDFSTDSSAQGPHPDFAHPLHVLQQILPSWNTWQPHAAVVSLLRDVLNQLESGHMIPPLPPQRFANAAGVTTWQGEESEAEAARTLLGRIHTSFPQAVTLVREYEYRMRVRQELARMVDEG